MAIRNANVPKERRIEFRMGIISATSLLRKAIFSAMASTSPRVWRALPNQAESAPAA